MSKFKDKLYNFFVRKNGRVWYEYERYVREHMEEHRLHRFKHLIVLFKLNWFYRIKKGNTPYLYWDVPLIPVVKEASPKISVVKKKNEQSALALARKTDCESQKYLCPLAVHLAKTFAKYEYIVLNIFDTLIYLGVNNKQNFFDLIGRELGVPLFSKIRIRVEEELISKATINGKRNSVKLDDIYKEMEKYTKIDYKRGVEAEVRLLGKISKANPYIKSIFEMISYKFDNVFLVEDSIYSAEHFANLLHKNGICGYKEILVSNECGKSILDGTLFQLLDERFCTKNVLYIDDNVVGQKKAKACGWEIWEYRDVNQLGNQISIDGMSDITHDLYKSIISQHMYCGQYIHSIQYEVGFIYYGIFMVGFANWIKNQIEKNNYETVLFLEETSDLIKQCYEISCGYSIDDRNVLWFTEETAVRVLVGKYPEFFYEYYINRFINSRKPISFYLGKMGLLEFAGKLADYGLTLSDEISRDTMFYGAFQSFIEDNFENFQAKYAEERSAICNYLKTINISSGNIAVVDIAGKGYVALALEYILNEQLNIDCKVKEITAFQTIPSLDLLFDNWTQSYISAENIREGDINLIKSELVQHRTRNILSNVAPVFKSISLNDGGEFEFIYEESYPWKYRNLQDSQQGIVDFVEEYASVINSSGAFRNVTSEDVFLVLSHLYTRTDYITKAFTIVRS